METKCMYFLLSLQYYFKKCLDYSAAEAQSDRGVITVRNPKSDDREPPKSFSFDAVFGPDSLQKTVYDVCASGVVDSVLNGYNGTIFAYGQVRNTLIRMHMFIMPSMQTGSGKTHTMEGRPDPPTLRGIIPNSFQHIFEHVAGAENVQFLVRASYLEIYNEEIRG